MPDSVDFQPGFSMASAGLDLRRSRQAFVALAELADGSLPERQWCIDDATRWLRIIWGPAGRETSSSHAAEFEVLGREVAAFIVGRLMNPSAPGTFCGLDLDLSRTYIRNVSFREAHFTGGKSDFRGCVFDEKTSFAEAHFSGGTVLFDGSVFHEPTRDEASRFASAVFEGSHVSFESVEFHNGVSSFIDSEFSSGDVDFNHMRLVDSSLSFIRTVFSGAAVSFDTAIFDSGSIDFADSRLTGGRVSFQGARFSVRSYFNGVVIDGGHLSFDTTAIGHVYLNNGSLLSGSLTMKGALVSGGDISFDGFTLDGGALMLDDARIYFGAVLLDKTSLLSGVISLEGAVVKFEGILSLPWATYSEGRISIKDTDFNGRDEHQFYSKAGRYVPGVHFRWAEFESRFGVLHSPPVPESDETGLNQRPRTEI